MCLVCSCVCPLVLLFNQLNAFWGEEGERWERERGISERERGRERGMSKKREGGREGV